MLEELLLKILDRYNLIAGESMQASIQILPVREDIGKPASRWHVAIGVHEVSAETLEDAAMKLERELISACKRQRTYHKGAFDRISKELGIDK